MVTFVLRRLVSCGLFTRQLLAGAAPLVSVAVMVLVSLLGLQALWLTYTIVASVVRLLLPSLVTKLCSLKVPCLFWLLSFRLQLWVWTTMKVTPLVSTLSTAGFSPFVRCFMGYGC